MAARGLQVAARHATICKWESKQVTNVVRPCKHGGFGCYKDVRSHAPRASSEEVEHGKLATPVAIPCSAAAFRAIPARLQSPPPLLVPFSPLHASLLAETCNSRHARNQRPPCLIRLGSTEHRTFQSAGPHFWKRAVSQHRTSTDSCSPLHIRNHKFTSSQSQ